MGWVWVVSIGVGMGETDCCSLRERLAVQMP